MALEHKRLLCL